MQNWEEPGKQAQLSSTDPQISMDVNPLPEWAVDGNRHPAETSHCKRAVPWGMFLACQWTVNFSSTLANSDSNRQSLNSNDKEIENPDDFDTKAATTPALLKVNIHVRKPFLTKYFNSKRLYINIKCNNMHCKMHTVKWYCSCMIINIGRCSLYTLKIENQEILKY